MTFEPSPGFASTQNTPVPSKPPGRTMMNGAKKSALRCSSADVTKPASSQGTTLAHACPHPTHTHTRPLNSRLHHDERRKGIRPALQLC